MEIKKRNFIKVFFCSLLSIISINSIDFFLNSKKFFKKNKKIWILKSDDT